jgi:two-component system cell cycle sensor histidine kinase/response regulator CckA
VKKLIELDHRVKVIVASGYSNDPVMADFKAYGFSGVITKPYDLPTLSRTLRTVLA